MLYSALVLGFLGSLHCMGMCGPIALMLPLDHKHKIKKYVQLSLYHLGRLFTYALFGFLVGLLGEQFNLFGWQQGLSIFAGVALILFAVLPKIQHKFYGIFSPLQRLIFSIKKSLGNQFKKKTPDTFFTIGFLNGFLPCGLLYAALFGSLALSDKFMGVVYMLFFGIGTIPLLSVVVLAGNKLNLSKKYNVKKIIPIIVVLIGFLFILRGLGLGIPYLSPQEMPLHKVSSEYNCFPMPE